MKKMIICSAWVSLVMMTITMTSGGLSQQAQASEISSIPNECRTIYGGEIPWPFGSLALELAHGENYTLVGTILVYNNDVYFQPDFGVMPWLANAKRLDIGVYPVQGKAANFRRFHNVKVKWSVYAQGMIGQTESGSFVYDLYLQSKSAPEKYAPAR